MNNNVAKYMKFSFIANFFLSLLKIVFGIISGVKSLLADGVHSLSDLTTDVVAIIGSKMSSKPADDNHPRGHGKIEYVTSLIISVFILFVSYSIVKNSLQGSNIIPNVYLSIVVVITIIIKYILSSFLINKGKKENSMILISSGKESFTDVFSSLVVLLALVVSQFYDKVPILKYSDLIASIIISIMIFIMGFRLLLQSLSLLVGESERSDEIRKKIKKIIKSREGKFLLKDYIIYKYGSYYEVIINILVDGNMTVREGHNLMDSIENDLLSSELNIEYVTIHIEPIEEKLPKKKKNDI